MENKYTDFANCQTKNQTYGGANGSKLCVIYDSKAYMLIMRLLYLMKFKAVSTSKNVYWLLENKTIKSQSFERESVPSFSANNVRVKTS